MVLDSSQVMIVDNLIQISTKARVCPMVSWLLSLRQRRDARAMTREAQAAGTSASVMVSINFVLLAWKTHLF